MRVVITGAAGRIATEVIEELSTSHDLRLVDRRPVPGRSSIVADLARSGVGSVWRPWVGARRGEWVEALAGADVVVHLAGNGNFRESWEKLFPDNVRATWNVIEAAAQQGVRRVVFASSTWAVKALERTLAPACYAPGGPKIDSAIPPRPLTPYGISKAFGEIAGRAFVDERRLDSFLAVRVGHYDPSYPGPPALPRDEGLRRLWIGTLDLRRLFGRCVEAKIDGFHVVYAVSAQPTAPLDLTHTRTLLGWEPCQTS